MRGAVEERRDGEGNYALRDVKDVADILTCGSTAFQHAVDALREIEGNEPNGVFLQERRRSIQEVGTPVNCHRVSLNIQLVSHNHHRLLLFDSHTKTYVAASLSDHEGNPLRFHALPGRWVIEGIHDSHHISLRVDFGWNDEQAGFAHR